MSMQASAASPSPSPHGSAENVAIVIRHLTKTFGTFQAVDDLSLEIQQGEIFGLLGPNGSGKTTTINMISGLSVPTSGSVTLLGHDVRRDSRQVRSLLGAVAQETALYEELSAWDNLDFHADLYGIPPKEKRQRITATLELVQLLDRRDSRVGTFSGGMKRRLALGRALLHQPQVIYLDEPTLGVDVQSRRAIWDYILALKTQGRTVLLTTNYLEEAQVLCDRLAILDHGKLIAIDTPAHLKATYGGSVVEIETEQPTPSLADLRALPGVQAVTADGTHLTIALGGTTDSVPAIINLLSREGAIKQIAIREPNLDDVFLRLTGKDLRD
jgi:ABC-2 type transport system ATP-binding protein